MKKFLFGLLFITSISGYSQEKFKKSFWIPEKITFEDANDPIYLMENKSLTYDALILKSEDTTSPFCYIYKEKLKEIHKIYPMGKTITVAIEDTQTSEKRTLYKEIEINREYLSSKSFKVAIPVIGKDIQRGYLKFEKGKINVNPYLSKKQKKDTSINLSEKNIKVYRENKSLTVDDFKKMENCTQPKDNFERTTYFYSLKNRQMVKIGFDEFFISALTVPVKYRFPNESAGLKEDFASGININVFGGYAIGTSKFMYREGVDNLTRESKFVCGIFLGTTTTEFNTNNTKPELNENEAFQKGILSAGFGVGYSIGKFQGVLFYGVDKAVGKDAELWVYNEKPWIGLGIGFEIME